MLSVIFLTKLVRSLSSLPMQITDISFDNNCWFLIKYVGPKEFSEVWSCLGQWRVSSLLFLFYIHARTVILSFPLMEGILESGPYICLGGGGILLDDLVAFFNFRI